MNKHESKYTNTAKRMHNALIALLEKKDFTDISITDICVQAGINRSTFYSHYENTAELAFDLEKTIIDKFERDNSDLLKAKITNLSTRHENTYINSEVLSIYLEFIKAHRRIFSIYNNTLVFNKPHNERVLKETIFIPAFKANGISDIVIMDYLFTYYMAGINSIIIKWVNEDCKIPVLTICEIIQYSIIKK